MKPSKKEMKCEVMWYTGGEAFEKKKKSNTKKTEKKGRKAKIVSSCKCGLSWFCNLQVRAAHPNNLAHKGGCHKAYALMPVWKRLVWRRIIMEREVNYLGGLLSLLPRGKTERKKVKKEKKSCGRKVFVPSGLSLLQVCLQTTLPRLWKTGWESRKKKGEKLGKDKGGKGRWKVGWF